MKQLEHPVRSTAPLHDPHWPILICLLGNFRLLQAGQPVAIRPGGKTEALLCQLGLHSDGRVPRSTLLQLLWPDIDEPRASQSLNSLVCSVRKQIGGAIGGAAPVLHEDGCYQLNLQAGVGVDVASFEALAQLGDRQARSGDLAGAAASYRRCIRLYRGDLCVTSGVSTIVQRERLRTRYLNLLATLADYYYEVGNHAACMEYAWWLLDQDPCREDAHRVVMRCYVRRGERTAALRHYQVCADILRAEFDVAPEPATTALFEQIRLDPASI